MIIFTILILLLLKEAKGQIRCYILNEEWIFRTAELLDASYIQLRLYTRNNPNQYQILYDPWSILQSNFNYNLPTVIFSDGLNKTADDEDSQMIKDVYLTTMDCNFFLLDWRIGSKMFYAPKAIRHSYAVGKKVAEFLHILQKVTGISYSSIHLIGVSLGAHLLGFVGKRIGNNRIGRITGLDPAGPCFVRFRREHRLHFTDAKFVDVISTGPGGLGINEPIGDINFRPNDQKIQKGCADRFLNNKEILSIIYDLCSHTRAVALYINSMLYQSCLMVGYSCLSYGDFLNGKCYDCGPDGTKCALLGYQASYSTWSRYNSPAVFYLNTSTNYNYCLFHYHVEIKFGNNYDRFSQVNYGRLLLRIIGYKNQLLFMLSQREEPFKENMNYKYLITSSEYIGEILEGKFLWYSTSQNKNPQLFINCIKIIFMSNIERDRYPVFMKNAMKNSAIHPGNWISLNIVSNC